MRPLQERKFAWNYKTVNLTIQTFFKPVFCHIDNMISDKYFLCYNDNSYLNLSVITVIINISLVKAIMVVQLKWQDFNSLFCKRNITYEPCYIDSYSNSTNMPIVKFFIVDVKNCRQNWGCHENQRIKSFEMSPHMT